MIHADFETRSVIDLTKVGVYKYAEDPSTDVNCLGWCIDDGEVELWEPGDDLPEPLLQAIKDGHLIGAWNAAFERLIWNNVLIRYGFPELPLDRFYCVAALARARGYPGKLEKVGHFADLPFSKDMEGHRLMMKLCRPRYIEEDGTVIWWKDRSEYLRQGLYCKRDVEVERAIYHQLIPFTDEELSDYHLSEEINDRGVHIDVELAEAAVRGVESERLDSDDLIVALTNGAVTSHTQVAKIVEWVSQQWKPITSLGKADVYDLLQETNIPPLVAEVLELRINNAKSAAAKYAAMLNHQVDGLVRGGYVYRGAGQTGRYTSLGVQRHNLLRKSTPGAIPALKSRGIAGLKMLGEPVQLLAEMVRPTFVAPPGKKFIVCDFAQIEARVTAWLAGEEKLLQLYRDDIDTYCAFGSIAFGKTITKADVLQRFVSKTCVLGLGFGGSEGALERGLRQGGVELEFTERRTLVKTYRELYSKIPEFWRAVAAAVLSAMYSKEIIQLGPVSYFFDGTHLYCRLPSGRLMIYPFAYVTQDEYGDVVEYRRGNRSPKAGVSEWPVVRLWHGIETENLAQAIALDLLQGAMRRLRNWEIRLHTHDEIVVAVDENEAEEKAEEMKSIMLLGESWSGGLPLDAEYNIGYRYAK